VAAMSEGWRKVDELSRDLMLAVRVTDGVTNGQPVHDPEVRVRGVDEQPVRNLSGYYLFFDLPEEEVTVTVAGGDRYHDATTTVDLDPGGGSAHDPGDAVELTVAPTPAYQFPAGLTRVRGTIFDGNATVPEGEVTVAGHPQTTTTTEAGEFVYYFDDIDSNDIVRADIDGDSQDERVYRPSGSDPVFEVTRSQGQPRAIQRSVTVEVGTRTTRDLNFQP
jgi:hypothetical protein